MSNAQTEARVEKLYRECRPDLNDVEWLKLRTFMIVAVGPAEKQEYNRLAPFQVAKTKRTVTRDGLCLEKGDLFEAFVITHPLTPASIPCSPHFRRELEAFRVASWLNRLESVRTVNGVPYNRSLKQLIDKQETVQEGYERLVLTGEGNKPQHNAKLDDFAQRMKAVNLELAAIEAAAIQVRRLRMTPPVDDDFLEVKFEYDQSINNLVIALRQNKRIDFL